MKSSKRSQRYAFLARRKKGGAEVFGVREIYCCETGALKQALFISALQKALISLSFCKQVHQAFFLIHQKSGHAILVVSGPYALAVQSPQHEKIIEGNGAAAAFQIISELSRHLLPRS